MDELLVLLYLARFRGVLTSTRDALPKYYQQQDIDPPVPELAVALPKAAPQLAEYTNEDMPPQTNYGWDPCVLLQGNLGLALDNLLKAGQALTEVLMMPSTVVWVPLISQWN